MYVICVHMVNLHRAGYIFMHTLLLAQFNSKHFDPNPIIN